jgi:hypothetical protein
MKFLFRLERSSSRTHQVPGLKCKSFIVAGEMDANSIYAVRDKTLRMAAIPGVYDLLIRNAAAQHEWRAFGPFDTRSPDQLPARPKTSNRKPKTGANQ